MADLTPELLAQLEEDVQGFPGRWESRFDDESDSIYYIDREGEAHEIAPDIEIEDVADPLARMLNALPVLVAAAKERDQLLTRQQELLATIAKLSATTPYAEEVQGWEGQRAKMIAEVGTLRAERDRAKAEISDVRGALDAHGHDGTFEAAAKLLTEVGSLRAERDQLRSRHEAAVADLHDMIAERVAARADLGQLQVRAESLESMVGVVAVASEGERDALTAHVRTLLQVIDRKSYSSAAQQEAVRAAEAAIGGVP